MILIDIICIMVGAIIGFMSFALMQAVKSDREDDDLFTDPIVRLPEERLCPYRRNISCNILEDSDCGDCEVQKW